MKGKGVNVNERGNARTHCIYRKLTTPQKKSLAKLTAHGLILIKKATPFPIPLKKIDISSSVIFGQQVSTHLVVSCH